MDTFYKKLGAKIKRIRERKDLSQESLAKLLKISRVSLSQIENGERKISAEEIAMFSKIFNIASDVLLDLEKDIEVVLEKKKQEPVKVKQELRINVP